MITITDKQDGQKKLRRCYEDYIPVETSEPQEPHEPETTTEPTTETTTEETQPTTEPAAESAAAEN